MEESFFLYSARSSGTSSRCTCSLNRFFTVRVALCTCVGWLLAWSGVCLEWGPVHSLKLSSKQAIDPRSPLPTHFSNASASSAAITRSSSSSSAVSVGRPPAPAAFAIVRGAGWRAASGAAAGAVRFDGPAGGSAAVTRRRPDWRAPRVGVARGPCQVTGGRRLISGTVRIRRAGAALCANVGWGGARCPSSSSRGHGPPDTHASQTRFRQRSSANACLPACLLSLGGVWWCAAWPSTRAHTPAALCLVPAAEAAARGVGGIQRRRRIEQPTSERVASRAHHHVHHREQQGRRWRTGRSRSRSRASTSSLRR